MATKANKAKLYQWPPPVYVARFAGGEECRMSVSSTIKGQYGFERARGIICAVIGNERGRAAALREVHRKVRTVDATYGPIAPGGDLFRHLGANYPPAGDLIAGHFEHDGAIVRDPLFLPAEVPQTKAKADPLARVLAAIGKLSADQREAVLAALVPIAGFDDGPDRRVISVTSRCGRYRMTVVPCDVGAAVALWRNGGRIDGGQAGAVMWRRLAHAAHAIPFHVALDRAHALINGANFDV